MAVTTTSTLANSVKPIYGMMPKKKTKKIVKNKKRRPK